MGRRPKPEGQIYIFKTIRIPPDLWRRFEALVPRGERSGVIHRLLGQEVDRLEWAEAQARKRDAARKKTAPDEGGDGE